MTLSSITNWSNEMKSTKAELLHWNFWQYVKLLCPPDKEEFSQLPGCTLPTVTQTLRYTKSWVKVCDEKNASFIRYLRFGSANKASSNFWYTTWVAVWGLLCASMATVSRVINTTPCCVLIAMVLHEALEERFIQKSMILERKAEHWINYKWSSFNALKQQILEFIKLQSASTIVCIFCWQDVYCVQHIETHLQVTCLDCLLLEDIMPECTLHQTMHSVWIVRYSIVSIIACTPWMLCSYLYCA